jgi:ribosomal protein S18 acetylase RimI-like enzyme
MPPVRDASAIRSILAADPGWSVYALGDLAPGFFEHSEWFRPRGGAEAIALLYRAFETPVLFAMGEAEAVASMLDEIGGQAAVYLHVRPEIVPVLARRYEIVELKEMCRMVLDWTAYRPACTDAAVRLSREDLQDLQRLYADGRENGEEPDFFFPSMLDDGVFYGVREGGELAAAAGTHLAVREEGVAAVGNVYTRRDRRGRGLAAQTTSAVVNELRGLTVALNVSRKNGAAIRVYERLGFRRHCDYYEGTARAATAPGAAPASR